MAAILRNNPTPIPTDNISTIELIAVICSAKTFKSGSAIVIITPTIKLIKVIIHTFLVFNKLEEIVLPISIIDKSAPRVNIVTPAINNSVLIIIDSIVIKLNFKIKPIISIIKE